MNERTIGLIGQENLEKLKIAKVLIVGIGGVGGTALECLVRSGFENITIIDADTVDVSNLNRQIISNTKVIGQPKTEVAKAKYLAINPHLNIQTYQMFLNEDNIAELNDFDYIIDACDTISTKIALIKFAAQKNIKIITCLGTGKKLDPTKLEITTLDKTYNDPLAKKLRQELKNCQLNKIKVVFSKELPKNNDKTITSMMMVPSTAGIYLAYYIINDILKEISN